MNWAISNLTGGNRVSRAILVRYSAVPLASDAADSVPQTPSSTGAASANVSTATFPGASFLHASTSTSSSRQHVPGRAVPQQRGGATATQLSLPLDVEETVTCFCR
ncbi:PREDICTED: MOB kinase activator-like 2 [Bactrocera latifrons]|uniref:MOB kinase activator-like 2 n=1 Tax=Bactrocera latifrons TaxID=174628 RepID=UPI0008DD0E55|nr:PREDICTED: MOB kinase activator-like 2 [Bactrocera latifrons]